MTATDRSDSTETIRKDDVKQQDFLDLEADGLIDRTDDFDFVTADDGSFVFTALDRTDRTDTRFTVEEVVDAETGPWDPDTDDDGLTDGQEAKWVTRERAWGLITQDVTVETIASDPDTDGDGPNDSAGRLQPCSP